MNLLQIAPGLLEQAQQEVKSVTVEEALFSYIVQIARRTRDWPSLSLGASPRAAVSLMAVSKAFAAMDGRDYVIPDDVKASARPVLRHRIMLRPEADLEGITPDQVLEECAARGRGSKVSDLGPLVPSEVEAQTKSYKRFGVAFGDRFFMLLFVGLVWLVPAFIDLRFVYALLAWDGLVLLAWFADLAQLPEPRNSR
jgi:hypothetical protein